MPLPYLWSALQAADRPIVIYGMGNGAEKVLDACAEHSIPIAGIFASDDFVRYQSFRGFTVKRYADLIEVMLDFGAVNAANLDGGTSSFMYYEGELVNDKASLYGTRKLPTAWIVK